MTLSDRERVAEARRGEGSWAMTMVLASGVNAESEERTGGWDMRGSCGCVCA